MSRSLAVALLAGLTLVPAAAARAQRLWAGVHVGFTSSSLELQVPIVLRIPTGGPVVPRFYSGPAVAAQLACQSSASDGVATVTLDCDQVIPMEVGDIVNFTETKGIDFGWMFGGGIDLAAGPGALTFDVRYNLGLTDINDFPGLDTTIKNRTLQLLTGYVLYFGG